MGGSKGLIWPSAAAVLPALSPVVGPDAVACAFFAVSKKRVLLIRCSESIKFLGGG